MPRQKGQQCKGLLDQDSPTSHHRLDSFLGLLQLTSCTGGARGLLNSDKETGKENLARTDGRSWDGNCRENCSASGEYLETSQCSYGCSRPLQHPRHRPLRAAGNHSMVSRPDWWNGMGWAEVTQQNQADLHMDRAQALSLRGYALG
jgi:hypothetical protein